MHIVWQIFYNALDSNILQFLESIFETTVKQYDKQITMGIKSDFKDV